MGEADSPAPSNEGLGASVTDAVEEQVEEASESVGRGRSPILLGLMGVGVSGRRKLVTSPNGGAALRCRLMAADLGLASGAGSGRRRLVTSPRGAAAFRCRLMAADLWLERGAGASEPGGVAVLARCVWGAGGSGE